MAARLAPRGYTLDIAAFQELDTQRRHALTEVEQRKAERNTASAEIARMRREGADTSARQQAVRALGEQIDELDRKAKSLDDAYRDLLARVPNAPHESVPLGSDATQNVEVRRCGEPEKFDFAPKPHWELGAELGILDLERAAKITGARFAVYRDLG
ncbi:MAG: serine--tRNA ligase, partial [Bryobacteraceae bacterium]